MANNYSSLHRELQDRFMAQLSAAGSQTELARRVGIDQGRIAKLVSGKIKFSNLTLETVERLFPGMLTERSFAERFQGRTRRPPRDPVNAMLSLGYSVLSSEIAGICASLGLDPACGLLHVPRFGRPALALDLMEEFRPLIADSVVVSLINRNEISPADFLEASTGCGLLRSGHQAF